MNLGWCLALLASVFGLTQQPRSNDRRHETPHLVVTMPDVAAPVARGARVTLRLDVVPKPGMHVYSPEQKDYIPVSLTLEKNTAFTARAAVFPKAEKYFFKALEETQLVYSKPFRIAQDVTVASTATAGPITVRGTLEYQACDDSVCYRPQKVTVEWRLTLEG